MKYISSRTNVLIQQVAALSSPCEREAQQLFIAEGLRTCAALCATKIKLSQLFVIEPLLAQAQQFAEISLIIEVTESVMAKISQATTPSGILGVFHIPTAPITIKGQGIVLARVREPGNVGTLIRSCAAFGFASVILIESAEVWSPKVVQATAGALGAVDVFVMNWKELLVRKEHLKLCALVIQGGLLPEKLQLADSLLVVGNEAHGIPSDWIVDCEQHMTLAMSGKIESLNAAVAGSIGLYEMAKQ